jgi:hypothetical protein
MYWQLALNTGDGVLRCDNFHCVDIICSVVDKVPDCVVGGLVTSYGLSGELKQVGLNVEGCFGVDEGYCPQFHCFESSVLELDSGGVVEGVW